MNRETGIKSREPGTGNREPDDAIWVSAEQVNVLCGFAEDVDRRSIVDHRDLDVWKLAMSFTTRLYKVTAAFPSDERYGLISQLRRAAVSIPTNIAEGYGRETSGAYVQFLRVAQGSAKEIQTLLELCSRLGFLKPAEKAELDDDAERIAMMLFRLIRAIERSKNR